MSGFLAFCDKYRDEDACIQALSELSSDSMRPAASICPRMNAEYWEATLRRSPNGRRVPKWVVAATRPKPRAMISLSSSVIINLR